MDRKLYCKSRPASIVFGIYGASEKYRNRYTFQELMDACCKKEWIPHCKETFNGTQPVIACLGKYTPQDCGRQPPDYLYG